MECPVLSQTKSRDKNIEYAHIYGNVEQQFKAIQVFGLLLEEREELITKNGASNLPMGLLDPDVTIQIL